MKRAATSSIRHTFWEAGELNSVEKEDLSQTMNWMDLGR